METKLTNQEQKVVDFLTSKNGQKVYWEELAQFAKEPQKVKLRTIQKTVSEIKRKFETVPFNCSFVSMTKEASPEFLQIVRPTVQQLVQIRKTPDGNTVRADSNIPAAHVDFVLDRNTRRVRTKFGSVQINENDWDVLKYFHEHVGRFIPISELRDKVVFPLFGSKLPMRWMDAIQRIVNNLRRAIPGLKERLRTINTVGGSETTYLFQ